MTALSGKYSGANVLYGLGIYGIFVFLAAVVREINIDWLNFSTFPEELKMIAAMSLLLIGLSFLFRHALAEVVE